MSTRGQIATFALILLIGLGIIALRNLIEIKNLVAPTAELMEVEFIRIGREQIELVGVLQVDNPNTRAIKLRELSYQLNVDGHQLLDQTLLEEITLLGQKQQVFRLPLTIATDAVLSLLRESHANNQVQYQMDASVRVALPGAGSVRVPVTKVGKLPVPRIPQIESVSWNLKELSWLHVDLLLLVQIHNPNVFTINLDAIQYQVVLQHLDVVKTGLSQAVELKPEQSLELQLPIRLDLREVGRSLFSALRQGEPLSYKLHAEAAVTSDWKTLRGYQIELQREGEFILDLSPSPKRNK